MKPASCLRTFGEIASFRRGLTFAKDDVSEASSKQVLRSNNISLDSCTLNFDDIACLRDDFVIPEDRKLHAGDIFICMSNGSTQHLGKVAYVSSDLDMAFGGFMGAIEPNRGLVVPRYMFYSCRSGAYRLFLSSIFNGANINNLKWSDLSKFEIPVPLRDVQERIVTELDLLTSVIDKQKTQLNELDTLAQSIFYDMFGDPINNPKDWNVSSLKRLSSLITNGNTPKGGAQVYVDDGILFLRSQNVWRNRIELDDVAYIDNATNAKLKSSCLKHNDILITKTGRINTENSSLGRAALFTGEDGSANINGHVYLVRLNDGINHRFVLEILTSRVYREYIRGVCVGGIDKRQINKEHVEAFPIIVPPLELQQKFADKIASIEKQKAAIIQSMSETQKLLDYTMNKYFG